MVVIGARDTLTALGMEVEVYFDLKNMSFVLNTHSRARLFVTRSSAIIYHAISG